MKKLLFAVLIAGAAWWYFVGGRKLTEEHVIAFYRSAEAATLERNPDALCSQLTDDFEATGMVTLGSVRQVAASQNKAETCEGYTGLYATFEQLGEKMGGMLQLDSGYQIHSIEISPDRKSAVVDITTSLDVAGSIMNIRSRTTDTLVRRSGKVRMQRSDGNGAIGSGS
jgi:hypothetical protein